MLFQRDAALFAALTVLVSACHDAEAPHTSTATTRWHLTVARGNGVIADPGEEGAEPLVAWAHDLDGHGIPGVPVSWTASGGGSIRREQSVTDDKGKAQAWWTLGADTASQRAVAQASPTERAAFHGWIRRAPAIPNDVVEPLSLSTYDGSGQVVHPDVITLPNAWNGGASRLAMAITPYPYGDARRENPSIFMSDGSLAWAPPAGAHNPIASSAAGYLSDPSLVYDRRAHRLLMYYREVANGKDLVWVVSTEDGVRWDAPVRTTDAPLFRLISPSVVKRGTNWWMYSINGGAHGCRDSTSFVELRTSADGLAWTPPMRVDISSPWGTPWHIDVHWIWKLREYWALFNVKPPGGCATPALYLATSKDGLQWTTYPRPVLQRGATPGFADIVYRSSLMYTSHDDVVTFYFSGARYEGAQYKWSGAVERRDRTTLFADLSRTPVAPQRAARRGLPDPELSISPRSIRRPVQ